MEERADLCEANLHTMEVAHEHYLNRQVAEEEQVDRRIVAGGDFVRGLGKSMCFYCFNDDGRFDVVHVLITHYHLVYGLFTEQFRQRFAVPTNYREIAYGPWRL